MRLNFNKLFGSDYDKTKKAIVSCQTMDQLFVAYKMVKLFEQKNPSQRKELMYLLEYCQVKQKEFKPVKFNQEIHAL